MDTDNIIMGKRILFKVTHPSYLSDVIFDSWTALSEHVVDYACAKVQEQMRPEFERLVNEMADEIMAATKEVDEP
jgi:hypothetical protein